MASHLVIRLCINGYDQIEGFSIKKVSYVLLLVKLVRSYFSTFADAGLCCLPSAAVSKKLVSRQ